MKTRTTILLALSGLLAWRGDAAETTVGDHTFTHPIGFTVELVAGPPLVDRPIEISLDESGRLYCTDSAGVNDKVQQQLEEKPHRVVRLEDSNGDGVYDRRVVFADQLMFPEGCLWHQGSLYVAAPPSIWKLTDTDGDGVADLREEWFQGKTLTGCANDLHGPYLGPDGWIYWTKGAFAEQTYELPGNSAWTTRAAHIFRARSDGTGLEPVMTGGMDNPVGVTFTRGGERIFTTTFFQHPGGGQRDGLIHAIYGGVYGKVHGVIEGHARTGELMPVLTHLGAAAPAGLTRYRSLVFGENYQDNLFSALFNMQRVMRHELSPRGGTFESVDEPFLVSNNRNFHPTDVQEDADGSLLVVDTGGWYKLCCPTSQLPKPDVLGGIYRVRKVNAPVVEDPYGEHLSVDQMTPAQVLARLSDTRSSVGDRLIARLGALGQEAVEAIAETSPAALAALEAERVIWGLSRIDSSNAREVTREFLSHRDPEVRLAAIHSASVHRDVGAVPALLQRLELDLFRVRRATAEALGRLGDARAVPALLNALGQEPDRVLEHSLIYALIEIGAEKEIMAGLSAESGAVRIGALIALDQLGTEKLPTSELSRVLEDSQPRVRRQARWVLGNRPELAAEMLPVLGDWMRSLPADASERAALRDLVVRLCDNASVADLLGRLMGDSDLASTGHELILEIIAARDWDAVPNSWFKGVGVYLERPDDGLMVRALRAARRLARPQGEGRSMLKQLMRLSVEPTLPREHRLSALSIVAPHLDALHTDQFSLLLEGLSADSSLGVRSAARVAVEKVSLNNQQLVMLARGLKTVGPLELGACLKPFDGLSQQRIGMELVSGLKSSLGRSALAPDRLQEISKTYPAVVKDGIATLLRELATGDEEKRQRLATLIDSLPPGDIRRGQAVFNSEKAACSSCHEIGYLGGDVGPDLTRIGRVRTREDLLEAVVYPSLSFVRSYEPYRVECSDGEFYSGIVRSDDGSEIILTTGPQQTLTLPKPSVVAMEISETSLMPSGIADILTPQELGDLITFLEATRW